MQKRTLMSQVLQRRRCARGWRTRVVRRRADGRTAVKGPEGLRRGYDGGTRPEAWVRLGGVGRHNCLAVRG